MKELALALPPLLLPWFAENARGQIIGDEHGFLKLVFHKPDMTLIGCHIIGDHLSSGDDPAHWYYPLLPLPVRPAAHCTERRRTTSSANRWPCFVRPSGVALLPSGRAKHANRRSPMHGPLRPGVIRAPRRWRFFRVHVHTVTWMTDSARWHPGGRVRV